MSSNASKANDLPSGTSHRKDLYQRRWVTDQAYISGLSGIVMLLSLAYLYHYFHVFEQGLSFFNLSLQGRSSVTAFALVVVCLTMVLVELVRLWRYDKSTFTHISSLWLQQRYLELALVSFKKYLLNLLLLAIAALYYYSINEYGFRTQASYYQPWFKLFELLCYIYLCLGLPYQFITLAFKAKPHTDMADLLEDIFVCIKQCCKYKRVDSSIFSRENKKIVLGFLVKLFFAPIMTVFFFDNLYHLVSNISYIKTGLIPSLIVGEYSHEVFNRDISNIFPTLIFTIDVALAWCGYVVSSRWLDNQTVSTEPTLIGWLVCLISYPPFRAIPGWFFSTPKENMYLQFSDQWLVTALAVLMIASYFLYMLPTIFFGVRFSNLTNRGIIRSGPFSYVRHPAYAAKNIAWWCVGMPVAIYSGFSHGIASMMLMLLGLVFITGVYYLRAVTEEKHLSNDPYYRAYCKKVKYRFIPNIV